MLNHRVRSGRNRARGGAPAGSATRPPRAPQRPARDPRSASGRHIRARSTSECTEAPARGRTRSNPADGGSTPPHKGSHAPRSESPTRIPPETCRECPGPRPVGPAAAARRPEQARARGTRIPHPDAALGRPGRAAGLPRCGGRCPRQIPRHVHIGRSPSPRPTRGPRSPAPEYRPRDPARTLTPPAPTAGASRPTWPGRGACSGTVSSASIPRLQRRPRCVGLPHAMECICEPGQRSPGLPRDHPDRRRSRPDIASCGSQKRICSALSDLLLCPNDAGLQDGSSVDLHATKPTSVSVVGAEGSVVVR